ncbi:NAD(P)-dependent alcohol dehydrogenase [Streptomyces sp. GC420]|uniref:NAD(P)-dependent alcohol dehydrogenase n=1 Tax=Streptomyces sp. GC420 TaxID=2697568 RepID=UPI0014152F90|nr:NAD(P)-dependent alcohol dehydrogenase [Streptomyces sp. GC420]NBM18228.1 alcohol dehydrogenase catalytic domain-containing protein [Streptomyces sp. GC420]
MRIQAALLESPGGPFTVRDVDIEEPRPDEILVRITAAGICHTDLSTRQGWPRERLPMVLGHEGAGVVEAVGEAVTRVAPGDTVCLSYRSCGLCEQCAAGRPAYCSAGLNATGSRADGSTPLSRGGAPVFGSFFGQSSFATHALAHESNTVRVPAGLPPVLAAPLGCGVQTGAGTVLNVLRPEKGSALTVFGAGGVGLSAVMAAVAEGCCVIAVDPVASRRALAVELGAAAAVDPVADGAVAATVRGLTAGGSHYAIDTTGRPDVITQALAALRRLGTLALVGIGARAEFDVMAVMARGIRIRGVIEGDAVPAEFIPRLVGLHRRGVLPVERLVSEFRFRDIEAAAAAAASGRVVKPVLTFD